MLEALVLPLVSQLTKMKNKKSIYILLPIVLFIWGAVIYQFFSFSDTEILDNETNKIAIKPFIIKPKDTFSIKVNSRDPFLGKITDDSQKSKVVKPKSKAVIVKEELVWPQIQYKGIVSDNKEKVKVFMVIINGKTYFMRKGDVENDVKLKEGNREIIYAVYKGDLKVVFIQ